MFGASEETTYLSVCVCLSVEATAGDGKEGGIDGGQGDVGIERSNGGVAMRQNEGQRNGGRHNVQAPQFPSSRSRLLFHEHMSIYISAFIFS